MSGYRIERMVGMGGMAAVYEARWLLPAGNSLPVACKLMREERRAVPLYRALVSQEAVLGLQVTHDHPNLVSVFDFFEDAQDRLCIVMELVDGGTVNDLLRPDRRLPFGVTRRIVKEVLKALAYLHGLDVLHRDLSPCNILVSARGAVKVSDLGIAKVMEQGQAHTHTFRGKPCYASPEALRCEQLDARSDLYALGTIVYELLAGAPPCGEEREPAKILALMDNEGFPPLPPETPKDLAELVMGLLRTDPDARQPQSAAEALALVRNREEPMASHVELAELLASMKDQRGDAACAGTVQVLAPGDVLAPRAPAAPAEALAPGDVLAPRVPVAPGQALAVGEVLAPRASPAPSDSLDSDVPVAPWPRKRTTAPFADAWRGSLSETRTMLGAGRRVAMRALGIALVMACGAVLGVLLHGRLRGEETAAGTQGGESPSQALMEAEQPTPDQRIMPGEPAGTPAMADSPRTGTGQVLAPRETDLSARETAEAAEVPRSSAAASTRKDLYVQQRRANAAPSKEPKNVAPVASIPQ